MQEEKNYDMDITCVKKDEFDVFSSALFEEESFLGWGDYFKVAIPTTLLCCAEWWAFEFIVIFAGTIGIDEVTA